MQPDSSYWDGPDVPLMEYTYRGGQKPLAVHPLHRLILQEIGAPPTAANRYLIADALMYLLDVGTQEDTLPVLLEVMRQDEDFRRFRFDGWEELFIEPLLYKFCKDNPALLRPYLLEEGLNTWFKTKALQALETIAATYEPARLPLTILATDLLQAYKEDLPYRRICDGYVVAFAIGIPIALRDEHFMPIIEEFYNSGLIHVGVQGPLFYVKQQMKKKAPTYPLPPQSTADILRRYPRFH